MGWKFWFLSLNHIKKFSNEAFKLFERRHGKGENGEKNKSGRKSRIY